LACGGGFASQGKVKAQPDMQKVNIAGKDFADPRPCMTTIEVNSTKEMFGLSAYHCRRFQAFWNWSGKRRQADTFQRGAPSRGARRTAAPARTRAGRRAA
jgi:fido (protein-threonine AMPylation protein)